MKQSACMDNLLDWFEDNKIIWVTILAVLAALEVMVTVIAAYILQKVKKIQKMRWVAVWSVVVLSNSIIHLSNIFRQFPPMIWPISVRPYNTMPLSTSGIDTSTISKENIGKYFYWPKPYTINRLQNIFFFLLSFNSRKSRTVSKRRLYDSSSDGSHSEDNRYLHRIWRSTAKKRKWREFLMTNDEIFNFNSCNLGKGSRTIEDNISTTKTGL